MKAEVHDPVAIVGVGCRFPGGVNDVQSFWRLLEDGVDAVAPMPPGRFDVDRFVDPTPGTPGRMVTADGGFLPDIDMFDAAFFGLSPREARKIDPQHRLLLEVAWEALEDAGIPPSSLAGRRVGVYVGIWSGEYENVMYRTPAELDFHSITGGGRYAASGRISYAFDLRGPAMTVDTGCSASLVALHLARQALDSGEADLAIVGAANLVLQPHVNIGYSRSGMLSAGARCRFGDADAAGYVRSDGAAALVLEPLSRAREARDRVRGVLLATGVNADGRGSGQLATPSADAQAELLSAVYARAGVDPSTVPYVEAHGTGTRAGDPVELEALGRVLGHERAADAPLIVGSVKTNIGHTEAAAGMAGLIKTLLALEHRVIPGNLHHRTPNETIEWGALRVQIPTAAREWPAGAPLIAGVSSFGITGTNAHAVLAAAPADDRVSAAHGTASVIALSARTADGLRRSAQAMRALSAAPAELQLDDLSYTTTCRRDHHEHRLAVIASSPDELAAGLDEYLGGESGTRAVAGTASGEPSVAFIFSGQGSQWLGMGRELLRTAPAFATSLTRCDEVLRAIAGWSVLDVINDDDATRLDHVAIIQPTLTCMQIAMSDQLRAWGIVPGAVAGHSMGEVAAAYCAGALSLEDALLVVTQRSRLLAGIAGAGAMALIDMTEAEVAELIGQDGVMSIAAVNGPRSTVISGDPTAIDELLERLDDDGVFCRRVKVDVASHSAQTDPLLQPLRDALNAISPAVPPVAFHSTARPGAPVDALLDAAYWVDNLRQPVRLMATVQSMIAAGFDTFIEVAPHPVLLSSLADIAADAGSPVRTLGGPRRDEPELRRCLELLARLHVSGADVEWNALATADARVTGTPHYAWQRERHWLDTWEDWSGSSAGGAAVARPERADDVVHAVSWEPVSAAVMPVPVSGTWLLIEDRAGVAARTAELLRARGASPVVVAAGDVAAASARTRFDGVIHFAALDARSSGAVSSDALQAGSVSALEVAQSLIASGNAVPTWWVTSGVHSVPGRAAIVDAWPQAATWGIARTLWQEHPELDAHLIDVDGDATASAAQIMLALTALTAEHQLAFSGDVPFAARLRPAGDALSRPASWPADASCLITGGLGALGLIAAQEMLDGGARRLILMARTPMPPRREWKSLPPGAIADRAAGILRLESMGASVHVAAVDVSDSAALSAWLEEFEAEGWPPVRQVVHCAGVLDNHLVKDMPAASLKMLMHGKAVAAENLARLIPAVDRTIYFSSTVPVLPQAGQANYAAANASLDAMAAARTAAGKPTVSVAWGVWKDAGLVADAKVRRYVETMEDAGLGSLDATEGRALFRWAAASTRAHVVIAPIDWAAAHARLAGRPGASFYGDALTTTAAPVESGLRALLDDAAPADRRALMVDHLRAAAARILDVRESAIAAGQPLGRQGLDSLMAMEFRNQLERGLQLRLPASLTWNYPTLERMADHLLERMYHAEPIVAVRIAADTPALEAVHVGLDPLVRAQVEDLSDDEIMQQLRNA